MENANRYAASIPECWRCCDTQEIPTDFVGTRATRWIPCPECSGVCRECDGQKRYRTLHFGTVDCKSCDDRDRRDVHGGAL
jgi:hypothetical protein